jgi:hypothetical protein
MPRSGGHRWDAKASLAFIAGGKPGQARCPPRALDSNRSLPMLLRGRCMLRGNELNRERMKTSGRICND